jgi:hypothetical protein
MQAYQLQSQLQERQSLRVFSALKEVRPQKMQMETFFTAQKVEMERVHGVRRVSKVLVEAQEPVVAVPVEELVPVAAEILRTLDLSWDNLVQVVARMVKLLGMV